MDDREWFENSYFYFREAVETLAQSPSEQCDRMGSYNVAWELNGNAKGAIMKWIGGVFDRFDDRSTWSSRWRYGRTLVCLGLVACVGIAMMLATQLAEARSVSGPYQVVMSKNPELCNYMANLINGDMSKIGVVRYDDHLIFRQIKWRGSPASVSVGLSTESAYIDTKNDGKKYLVFRVTSMLSGMLIDSLFIYSGQLLPKNVLIEGEKIQGTTLRRYSLKPTPDEINPFERSVIRLNELPAAFKEKYFAEQRKYFPYNKAPSLPVMGPYFALRPFVWEGTYYLSVSEQGPPGLDRYPKWFLIAKYLHGEDIQHICYLDNPKVHVNY